jgi:hypothetical protein
MYGLATLYTPERPLLAEPTSDAITNLDIMLG